MTLFRPGRPHSLLRQIVVRLSATTLVAIVVAYGWLWWEFESTAGSLRTRSLFEAGHTIEAALIVEGAGETATVRVDLPIDLLTAYRQAGGAHRFAVRDGRSGQILAGEGGAVGAIPDFTGTAGRSAASAGVVYQYDPDGPGPISRFGVAERVRIADRLVIVQVEREAGDYQLLMESMLEEFFEDGGWLGGPFLLALLAVSIITIRRSLAPLQGLSRQAEAITPTTTSIRLPEHDLPTEVLPLVRAVNSALDRLEEGFRIQREFTADAAHELRTPLAILGAHIDTLADRTVARDLRKDLDAMTRLVGQLLKVARAEAMVLSADDHADLNAIACEVAAWLGPMAIGAGRTIEVITAEPGAVVNGSMDAILDAVRNLVENGLAHTPVGTAVSIRVTADPALSVRDHGPGIPADRRERIFQRFWRADRRRSGAGLGLAIVRRIVEAHGGSVQVKDAEGGGALFLLRFPAPKIRAPDARL